MDQCLISSHSQWQPLREVWIGGVYPESFYAHLGAQTQDIFAQITEITRQDFVRLKRCLTDLNIRVEEPSFDNIDLFLDEEDRLLKPPISPCDFALVLSDTLYINPQYPSGHDPYYRAINRYQNHGQHVHVIDRSGPDPWAWICFPSVVRMGRDILIDYDPTSIERTQAAHKISQLLGQTYRVHVSNTGDHSDGVFCPLRPGEVFTSHYRAHYTETLPGWRVFHLKWPDVPAVNLNTHQKWHIPGIDYMHFNPLIMQVAKDWLGMPHETVFDVNMLVVDENNIICGAHNEEAFKHFEDIGMTPHVVDFQSRYFWDAGIHCVTADIARDGVCEDYWPGRGDSGMYVIQEWE